VTRKLLWALPVALILLLLAGILALPGFVASSTHRPRIEAMASALTGREVHIAGKLSLGLLPGPEITASHVTITGPDRETIQARSLTLDISLPALLHGRLSAQNLTLASPHIEFPWPLPGGGAAITPPDWLAALHAQIRNGDISLGAAHFTGVDADIFTGANGAVSVSGTGTLAGHALTLSLALGAVQLTGATPVTLDASSGDTSLHFSGALDAQSTLAGQLGLASPGLSGTGEIIADGGQITASALQMTSGKGVITGTATYHFLPSKIAATLNATNLNAAALPALLNGIAEMPVALTLSATNLLLPGGIAIPALQTSLTHDGSGTAVQSLLLTLPGSSALSAKGQISPGGAVTGQASGSSPDLPDLFAGYGMAPPPGLVAGHFSADLSGTIGQLTLGRLNLVLGDDDVTGTVILTRGHVAGALQVDRLDLQALLGWLGRGHAGFSADGEIAAANANFGKLAMTHLLLDAALTDQLNIRRISANMAGGLAAGSITLNGEGLVTAARGFVALPSAAPLAALLPPKFQPKAALADAPLNMAVSAQGRSSALATSMVATLGDFSFTAAPVLNLTAQTAAGPVTLRHPSAIAAFRLFGLNSGLDWPGPGSIALRADFTASPSGFGLPDFVLSVGNLTANGRLIQKDGAISGQIDADTLALPPLATFLPIPWPMLAALHGGVDLSANHVLYNGNTILGAAKAHLALAPNTLNFVLANAALAGGTLSGGATVALSATAPPALTAQFSAAHLDPAQLNLPLAFPFTLQSGTLSAAWSLTASGYSPKIWLATLGGSASLNATNGSLSGFSLQNLAKALGEKNRSAALRAALASGSTAFATLGVSGQLSHGNCTLATASLSGPDGSANATGSVDMFDEDLALHLTLQPKVKPAIGIGTSVLGSWDSPKQYPRLKPALGWVTQQGAP
jgi:hypothetical protein